MFKYRLANETDRCVPITKGAFDGFALIIDKCIGCMNDEIMHVLVHVRFSLRRDDHR